MSYTVTAAQALARLSDFDAIVDVRSPAEFAEDHLPGAINWPVLDDDERRTVGTLYATSPFEARKIGAALVARNIARHIEQHTESLGKTWRPLVYCWRGGQRSGAMNWFLGQIGFRSRQMLGGYKAYRAEVRDLLQTLPRTLDLHVLCGRTGSGKTRLLQALAAQSAQVLDLEALACHRGSVLGAMPTAPQPSQKRFDSLVWQHLRALDPTRPVFIESESRKIGQLRVPEVLHEVMRASTHCLWIEMPDAARIELLLQDYGHFAADAEGFCRQLDGLVELRGKDTIRRWQSQARAGAWTTVFGEMIREHYDPGYERSLRGHFPHVEQAQRLTLVDGGPASLQALARSLVQG